MKKRMCSQAKISTPAVSRAITYLEATFLEPLIKLPTISLLLEANPPQLPCGKGRHYEFPEKVRSVPGAVALNLHGCPIV
ncbi:hypothetical protein V2G26_016845, partial [Clonostachys chloroleuca]